MSAGALPPHSHLKRTRALLGIQTAKDLNSFWRASLRALRSLLPHHSCSLMLGITEYQPSKGRHFVAAKGSRANQPVNSLSISRSFLAAHPRVKIYAFVDVVREDPRAVQRGAERRKIFQGWDDFVHLAFWDKNALAAVLSIRRSREQGKFRPSDRKLLEFLHPLFDMGLKRLRLLEKERNHRRSLEHFISGMPVPVMFLREDRELAFATQEAYDLCALWSRGFKIARSVNSRASISLPEEIEQACVRLLKGHERSVSEGSPGGPVNAERIRHPSIPGLVARVEIHAPEQQGAFAQPSFRVTFYSTVNLDGAQAELRPEVVHRLSNLTTSERRVALLVAEGRRNGEVARQLGKSVRTVDFQLNTIYRKLEIRSRTELTRLLT
jgi:DNA-binding CsgD family transcriptional regulator